MSDIQCPATLLLTPAAERPAGQGGVEREQARQLADSLRSARVAKVYCSDAAPAARTAEVAADALGVSVEALPGLGPRAERESDADVVARTVAELEGIVDQHRGETVLVVGHGDLVALAVPYLALNLPADFARGRTPGEVQVTEVAADADGWMVRRWDGAPPYEDIT